MVIQKCVGGKGRNTKDEKLLHYVIQSQDITKFLYFAKCSIYPWFLVPPPLSLLPFRVSQNSDRNLMKSSNIGVVFGPTLMRPKRESVATVVNIKYHNIVVEVMVEWMDKVRCGSK